MRGTGLEIWIEASYIDIEITCIGQNMELKGIAFEIQVKTSCTSVKSFYISQNLEVGSISLEIQVKTSLLRENTEICFIYKCHIR